MSESSYVDEEDDLLFLTIGTLTGSHFPVNIFASDTIMDLKAQIESIQGIPSHNQILVYKDHNLTTNSATLAQCDIRSGAYIQLLVHMAGGHPPPIKSSLPAKQNHSVLFLLCKDKDDFYVLELRVNSPTQLKELQEKYLSTLQNPSHIPLSVLENAIPLNEFVLSELGTQPRPDSANSVASFHSEASSRSGIMSIPSSINSSRSSTPSLPTSSQKKPSSASATTNSTPRRFRANRPATTISITPVRLSTSKSKAQSPILNETKRAKGLSSPVLERSLLSCEPTYPASVLRGSTSLCLESKPSIRNLSSLNPLIPPQTVLAPSQPNQCKVCLKKLGITKVFKCKCGGVFCGVHRYSDRHECSYNYKEAGKIVLTKENPMIVKPKLEKI